MNLLRKVWTLGKTEKADDARPRTQSYVREESDLFSINVVHEEKCAPEPWVPPHSKRAPRRGSGRRSSMTPSTFLELAHTRQDRSETPKRARTDSGTRGKLSVPTSKRDLTSNSIGELSTKEAELVALTFQHHVTSADPTSDTRDEPSALRSVK